MQEEKEKRNIIYASATTDTGFKQLFSDLNVAKDIINCITNLEIKSLTPISVNLPILKKENESQTFMDFHAKTEADEDIIVEMQAKRHLMFDERALYYLAGTFFEQMSKAYENEDLDNESKKEAKPKWYYRLKKVISIQILNYDSERASGIVVETNSRIKVDPLIERRRKNHMKENQYIKDYEFVDKYSGQVIDMLRMIQVELPRAERILQIENIDDFDNNTPRLNWWLSAIRNTAKYNTEIVSRAPDIVQLGFKRLYYKTWNNNLQDLYLQELKERDDYDASLQDKVGELFNEIKKQNNIIQEKDNKLKEKDEELKKQNEELIRLKEKDEENNIRFEFFKYLSDNNMKFSIKLKEMLNNNKNNFENKVTKFLSKKILTNPAQLSKEEKEKRTMNIKNFINSVMTADDERFTEDDI